MATLHRKQHRDCKDTFHSSVPSKSEPESLSHSASLNLQHTLFGTRWGAVPFKQAWAKEEMNPTMVSPAYVVRYLGFFEISLIRHMGCQVVLVYKIPLVKIQLMHILQHLV